MYDDLIMLLRAETIVPYATLKMIRDAADAIEELQKKLYFQDITTAQIVNMYMPFFIPKWIPVTERLPDKRGDYLVFTSNSTITIATWGGERFYISEFAAVTHWMPLPEPPKDGEA